MARSKKKYRILIAEDDKYLSAAYREGLTRYGFEVLTAFDGAEALEKIAIGEPDLVLLDTLMPVKDGFAVLEELNRDGGKSIFGGGRKKIPVIMFSNIEQSDDKKRAQELGAVDYLVKANYSLNNVIKKIEEHLGISEKTTK
jgi:CheY-like chemotaxis protein